jgi:ATP-dependent Lon protease
MKHSYPTLYLFNNVFFPQTVIPLTVSDGVSKDLLLECYELNQNLIFYHPTNRSKKIGTVGKILILEHNADQSMTVMVQGILRVQLLTQEQHIPFPIFEAEDYFDNNEKNTVLEDSVERLHEVLADWLHRHISSTKERAKFMKEMNTPQRLINNLCLLVIKDVELKDIFLASVSLPDRIRMMDALLRGKSPEIEDMMMSEAIKNFERLEPPADLKNAI